MKKKIDGNIKSLDKATISYFYKWWQMIITFKTITVSTAVSILWLLSYFNLRTVYELEAYELWIKKKGSEMRIFLILR